MLKFHALERLGAGTRGSENDYSALKCHPFFSGVDFQEVNNFQVVLAKRFKEPSPITKSLSSSTELSNGRGSDKKSKSTIQDPNSVYHEGEVKKRNKYLWNQVRWFRLYRNGRIDYLKHKKELRGTLQLTADSLVTKTAKDKFEI